MSLHFRLAIFIMCSLFFATVGHAKSPSAEIFNNQLAAVYKDIGLPPSATVYNQAVIEALPITAAARDEAIRAAALALSIAKKNVLAICQKKPAECLQQYGKYPVMALNLKLAIHRDQSIENNLAALQRLGVDQGQRLQLLMSTYQYARQLKTDDLGEEGKMLLKDLESRLGSYSQTEINKLLPQTASIYQEQLLFFNGVHANVEKGLKDIQKLDEDIPPASDIAKKVSLARGVEIYNSYESTVKSKIYSASIQLITATESVQTAASFAGALAKDLNLPENVQNDIKRVGDAANKAQSLANIALTFARAGSGDVTAYLSAASSLSSVFGGGEMGPPPMDPELREKLEEILENQYKMMASLERIETKLVEIDNKIDLLVKQSKQINSNLEFLIALGIDERSDDYTKCRNAINLAIVRKDFIPLSNTISTSPPDLTQYMRDMKSMSRIYKRTDPEIVACSDFSLKWLPPLGQLNPANNKLAPSVLRQNGAGQSISPGEIRSIIRYWKDVTLLLDEYTKSSDNVDDISLWEIYNGAAVPSASNTALVSKYRDGVSTIESLGKQDPVQAIITNSYLNPTIVVNVVQNHFEVVPYTWIYSGWKNFFMISPCDGIHCFSDNALIDSIKRSIVYVQFSLAQQTLINGDATLFAIDSALRKDKALEKGPYANKTVSIIRSSAYAAAVRVLADNPVLRENYLRYIIFKSFSGKSELPSAFYDAFYSEASSAGALSQADAFDHFYKFGDIDVERRLNSTERFGLSLPCYSEVESAEWFIEMPEHANENDTLAPVAICQYPLPPPNVFRGGDIPFDYSKAMIELLLKRDIGIRLLTLNNVFISN